MRVIFDRRGDFRIQVDFRTPKMNNLCSEKVTERKQGVKKGLKTEYPGLTPVWGLSFPKCLRSYPRKGHWSLAFGLWAANSTHALIS